MDTFLWYGVGGGRCQSDSALRFDNKDLKLNTSDISQIAPFISDAKGFMTLSLVLGLALRVRILWRISMIANIMVAFL